jgi:hypothetical protein
MHFRHYPAERLRIASIASRLDPVEARLREAILAGMVARQRPLSVVDLQGSGFSVGEIEAALQALVAKRAIVRDEGGNISFAYPVSALPTGHRVTLADGRSFHAMCAVDALGSAFTFRQDVSIDSRCSQCRQPVAVDIRDGRLAAFSPPELHVLHVDLNRSDNWSGSC